MSLHTHQNLWQNASRLLRRPRSSSLIWLKQGARPNTNKAELFWFGSTVVVSRVSSGSAELLQATIWQQSQGSPQRFAPCNRNTHTHTKIASYVFELQMQVSCLWLCFGNIVDRSDHSVVEATATIPLRELHAYFSNEMSTQIIGQRSSNYWRWAVDPVTDAQGCFSCKLMWW